MASTSEKAGDHQFIHVDPERAKQTPFGTTIAHGFLTLALLIQLALKVTVDIEGEAKPACVAESLTRLVYS